MLIYHYHARKQLDFGRTADLDGIVNLLTPVLTMDDYRGLKKLIAECDGGGIGGPEGMTICSLTLLQELPNV